MKYGIVKDIILYAVILLVQILILNHIHLFGVATPLLYVYLIMLLSVTAPDGHCCSLPLSWASS